MTGKAATSFMWANQMPELQKNTKDDAGRGGLPGRPEAPSGPAPSMYFSVFRGSQAQDVAVDVINFLVNDPEAGKISGTDRGLPSNLDVRKAVADDA